MNDRIKIVIDSKISIVVHTALHVTVKVLPSLEQGNGLLCHDFHVGGEVERAQVYAS